MAATRRSEDGQNRRSSVGESEQRRTAPRQPLHSGEAMWPRVVVTTTQPGGAVVVEHFTDAARMTDHLAVDDDGLKHSEISGRVCVCHGTVYSGTCNQWASFWC